jgi:hypothetical protein
VDHTEPEFLATEEMPDGTASSVAPFAATADIVPEELIFGAASRHVHPPSADLYKLVSEPVKTLLIDCGSMATLLKPEGLIIAAFADDQFKP